MPLSYDLTTFYILGQKFVKFFVGFLEKFKKSKRHSDINRPLKHIISANSYMKSSSPHVLIETKLSDKQ